MISRPLWASGMPCRDFRNPLFVAGADVRMCSTDTGRVHGPALPTTFQVLDHPGIGFGRYCGPWITRSGFRVADGPQAPRRIPNPADLRRTPRTF